MLTEKFPVERYQIRKKFSDEISYIQKKSPNLKLRSNNTTLWTKFTRKIFSWKHYYLESEEGHEYPVFRPGMK